jgi:hypothetical protein
MKNLLNMRQIISNKLYNLINFNAIKNSFNFNFNTIYNYLDSFLLTIVIFTLLGDFIYIMTSIVNYLIDFYSINGLDLIHNMSDTNSNVNGSNTTNTSIIHDDGSWSNVIKSIFIYGSGGYRLSLLKGDPGSRSFVIGITILGAALSREITNTINDPNSVRNHIASVRATWKYFNNGEAIVNVDPETPNKLKSSSGLTNNFIGGEGSLGDLYEELLNGIFDRLKFILEPVQVNYSNEILSNQIHDISILLFIFSLIIFGLIVVLLLNIVLYINMDSIIKFFNNKFIRGYLLLNKKFLSIEIFMLGGTILWFMYILINSIHFIATHPIIIN